MDKIICKGYRAFISGKPCCVCFKAPVDFDHLTARGTGSAKQNDFTGLPLCRWHHTERGQIGNPKFEAKYKIDLWKQVSTYLTEFLITRGNMAIETDRKGNVTVRA